MHWLLSFVWSWIEWKTILVLLAVYYATCWLQFHGYFGSKGKRLPPSFYGLPYVGTVLYFFFSKKTTLETLEELTKRHGPVLRARVGRETNVIISGTKAVREAMQMDDLLGRPQRGEKDDEISRAFDFPSIISIEGDLWRKHRRFSLMTLRDLGFGKTPVMEEYIQEELRDLFAQIDSHNGAPLDFQTLLTSSASNNISTLVFGERLSYDNPKRAERTRLLNAFADTTEQIVALSLIPFLSKLMFKLDIGIISRMRQNMQKFKNMMKEETVKHRANVDKDNLKDYLDYYVLEQEKDKAFTDQLADGNSFALFAAGTSTVRVTLEYLLHLMTEHPEVAEKVQKEVDEISGRSREITWADSQNMPYTNAVIAERHRYFPVTPFGVPRRTLRETKVLGYDLDAHQQVIFNIDSVHYDPSTFPSPYTFDPSRFISSEGKLINTEKIIPFAMGKRACPGESLAVMEIFLYFANIMLNFNVQPHTPGQPLKFKRLRCLAPEVVQQKIRLVRRQ